MDFPLRQETEEKKLGEKKSNSEPIKNLKELREDIYENGLKNLSFISQQNNSPRLKRNSAFNSSSSASSSSSNFTNSFASSNYRTSPSL